MECTEIWTALKKIFLIWTRFQAVVCEIYFVLSSSKQKRLNRSENGCYRILIYGYAFLFQFIGNNYLRENRDSEYKKACVTELKNKQKCKNYHRPYNSRQCITSFKATDLKKLVWYCRSVPLKILLALSVRKFFHYTLGNEIVRISVESDIYRTWQHFYLIFKCSVTLSRPGTLLSWLNLQWFCSLLSGNCRVRASK